MFTMIKLNKTQIWRKCLCSFVCLTFSSSLVFGPTTEASAQYITNLPKPGEMVLLSPAFQPTVLKGITIHPENPLQFDFIVDRGDDMLSGNALKDETQKLLKFFLAAMTIPDDDAWVNLSPYESDRIIPDMLGTTDMGRAMLEQDYLLKQLSASLTNPQEEIGKNFWNTVYKKAYEKFGTTTIPINTFNKVWIIPDSATVVEKDGSAFIGETHLKVMLDEDYTSVKENIRNKKLGTDRISKDKVEEVSAVSSQVVREVIIPELEKEINQGKNFSAVRQMYNAVILATWYKQALKNSLLSRIYVDKNKIAGVDTAEKDLKQKIYEQYLEAFRKGVYNLIKEDYDLASKETLPRKYFSGGFDWKAAGKAVQRVAPESARGSSALRDAQSAIAGGRFVKTDTRLEEPAAAPVVEKLAVTNSNDAAGQIASRASSAADNLVRVVIPANREYLSSLGLTDDTFDYWKFSYQEMMRRKFPQAYAIWRSGTGNGRFFANRIEAPIPAFGPGGNTRFDADYADGLTVNGMKLKVGPQVFMKPEYKEDAKGVPVVLSDLNAGFGENLGRTADLAEKIEQGQIPDRARDANGLPILGAKSMDLFIEVALKGDKTALLSVFELRLLRAIKLVRSGTYQKISLQELVNEQSLNVVNDFLNKKVPPFVYELLGVDAKAEGLNGVTTYRVLLNHFGINLLDSDLYQSLSSVNPDGTIAKGKTSNAGHGLVAYRNLYKLMDKGLQLLADQRAGKAVEPEKTIYAFMNGDGPNNWIPPELVGWMTRQGVGMALIGVPREMVDIKVGAAYVLEGKGPGGKRVEFLGAAEIGELKTSPVALKAFLSAGRTPKDLGKQWANTNTALINGKMAMFLAELSEIVGRDTLAKAMMPSLILSEKEGVFRLEGAMITTLFNTFNFVNTSQDPKVKDLMTKYGFDQDHPLLALADVGRELRDTYFTPIKFIGDWLGLENLANQGERFGALDEGLNIKFKRSPGLVNFDSDGTFAKKTGIKSYADLKEARESLGNRGDWTGMDTFTVYGRIKMQDATLEGNVHIENYNSEPFDVDAWVANMRSLGTLAGLTGVAITDSGSVSLKDIIIVVAENGKVRVSAYNMKWAELSSEARKLLAALERIYADKPIELSLQNDEAVKSLLVQASIRIDAKETAADLRKKLTDILKELGFVETAVVRMDGGVSKQELVWAYMITEEGQTFAASAKGAKLNIISASSSIIGEDETPDAASSAVTALNSDGVSMFDLMAQTIGELTSESDRDRIVTNLNWLMATDPIDRAKAFEREYAAMTTEELGAQIAGFIGQKRPFSQALFTENLAVLTSVQGFLDVFSGKHPVGSYSGSIKDLANDFVINSLKNSREDTMQAQGLPAEIITRVLGTLEGQGDLVLRAKAWTREVLMRSGVPAASSAVILVVGQPDTTNLNLMRQLEGRRTPSSEYIVTDVKTAQDAREKIARLKPQAIIIGNAIENASFVEELLRSRSIPNVYLFVSENAANSPEVMAFKEKGVYVQSQTQRDAEGNVRATIPQLVDKIVQDLSTEEVAQATDALAQQSAPLVIGAGQQTVVSPNLTNVTTDLRMRVKVSGRPDYVITTENIARKAQNFDLLIGNTSLPDTARSNFTYGLRDGKIVKLDNVNEPTTFEGQFELSFNANNQLTLKSLISGQINVEYESVQALQAQSASSAANVGGIDFDPSLLNLQIKRDGRGVPLPIPQQNIERINIDGLFPVIINMQPATLQNFPFLLSAQQDEKIPELSKR